MTIREMNSFENITNLSSTTDKGYDSRVSDVDTFDQSNSFEFFEVETKFETTDVGDTRAGSEIQVP
jgi:hypothetical protein